MSKNFVGVNVALNRWSI